MILKSPGCDASTSLRWLVAITPLVGAIGFPLAIPIVMIRIGVGVGIGLTLVLSLLWFIVMLKTAEMPH
ncbi:hypothetical protein [Synechococcus sp. M16CYN]|uniref:hypothetical protein n=1 Tax=Synechococcus sp. M16CYN TaxID=3103139 RepID=UPI00324CF469